MITRNKLLRLLALLVFFGSTIFNSLVLVYGMTVESFPDTSALTLPPEGALADVIDGDVSTCLIYQPLSDTQTPRMTFKVSKDSAFDKANVRVTLSKSQSCTRTVCGQTTSPPMAMLQAQADAQDLFLGEFQSCVFIGTQEMTYTRNCEYNCTCPTGGADCTNVFLNIDGLSAPGQPVSLCEVLWF